MNKALRHKISLHVKYIETKNPHFARSSSHYSFPHVMEEESVRMELGVYRMGEDFSVSVWDPGSEHIVKQVLYVIMHRIGTTNMAIYRYC